MATISLKGMQASQAAGVSPTPRATAPKPAKIDHNAAMASFAAEDSGTAAPPERTSAPSRKNAPEPIDANKLRADAGEKPIYHHSNGEEHDYPEGQEPEEETPAPPKKSDKRPKSEDQEESGEESGADAEEPEEKADPFSLELPDPEEKPGASEKPGKRRDPGEGRDYTGIDQELVPMLKKLPNHLFEDFKDKLPKWKKAFDDAGKVPQYLAAHKEGYLLNDNYRSVTSKLSDAGAAINHLHTQLDAVTNGKAWQNFIGYDANGQPRFQEVPAPKEGTIDTRAKMQIEQELSRIYAQQATLQQEEQRIRTEHGTLNARELRSISEAKQRIFGQFEPTEAELKWANDMKANVLPFTNESNPLWPLFVPLMISYQRSVKMLRMRADELEKEIKGGASKKPRESAAPPAGPNRAAKPSKNGLPNGFANFDEYKKWLEGN